MACDTKIKMHAKRNTESVSKLYETDSVFRFACILIFLFKLGLTWMEIVERMNERRTDE